MIPMLACPPDRVRVIDGFGMLPACLQASMVGADGLEPPTLSV